ncbi:MAG: HNH endonuclease, partial [Acidithiobacillus sp.]
MRPAGTSSTALAQVFPHNADGVGTRDGEVRAEAQEPLHRSRDRWVSCPIIGKTRARLHPRPGLPQHSSGSRGCRLLGLRIQLDRPPMKGRKQPFCVYCGSTENITVDHVVPLSRWREFHVRRRVLDNKSNRVPCCLSCNAANADMHPREWLEAHPEYRARFRREAKYL